MTLDWAFHFTQTSCSRKDISAGESPFIALATIPTAALPRWQFWPEGLQLAFCFETCKLRMYK